MLGEWKKPYLTMDTEYQATIAQAFVEFLEKGYVYRGLKPVHYCISCRTALAEAEVEYKERQSPSIYVKYRLRRRPGEARPGAGGKGTSTLSSGPPRLGRSRPAWPSPSIPISSTLPSQKTVKTWWFWSPAARSPSCGRWDSTCRTFSHEFPVKSSTALRFSIPSWSGKCPVCWPTTSPPPTVPVRSTPPPATDARTLRPATGTELKPIARSANPGEFVEGLPEYKGKNVFRANEPIIKLLESRGALLGSDKLTHSYPHCWRCHQPVIFRASRQWFIAVDHNELRKKSLEEIRKVRWLPKWGEDRISNMIAVRPDWCISRQRLWGVPITVVYCEKCDEPLLDPKIGRHVVEIFRREGADAWYTRPASELVPKGTKCPQCGGSQFGKEKDILDVWFDSGSSHLAVLGERTDLPWPSDMYLEAGDQHRGWFHSSLLVGVGLRDRSPYRTVLTHGWVIDAKERHGYVEISR